MTAGFSGRKRGFCDCANLKYLKLPTTLVKISDGDELSYHCFTNTSIEELIFPDSVSQVTTYRGSLFSGMSKLKRIVFGANYPIIKDESSAVSTLNVCFKGCSALEQIVLPEGKYFTIWRTEMFKDCTKLDFTNILNLEHVKRTGANAFFGVTVPNQAKGIPSVFNMPNLISINQYVFQQTNVRQVDLLLPQNYMVTVDNAYRVTFRAIYVNDNLYDTYRADANWSKSASVLYRISEYVEQ